MQSLVPLNPTQPTSLTQPAVRSLWAAGTMLRATVVDIGMPGRVQLQIGHHALEARTTLPLRQGQTLNVRVSHAGELVILEEASTPAPREPAGTAPGARAQVESALRQTLPAQRSLAPLLGGLAQAATQGDPQLKALAQGFLARLPAPADLRQAGGMARLLALAGVTREATQAGGQTPPSSDLKGALSRLIADLGQSLRQQPQSQSAAVSRQPPGVAGESLPPLREGAVQAQPRSAPPPLQSGAAGVFQLLEQAEGALARVQLSQLASVPVDDGARQVWMGELALRGDGAADVVQFRIERERQGGGSETPDIEASERWTIDMALAPEALGEIEARVSLLGESVTVGFRAARAATVQLIDLHLAGFGETLSGHGFEVTLGACRHGLAPKQLRMDVPLVEAEA